MITFGSCSKDEATAPNDNNNNNNNNSEVLGKTSLSATIGNSGWSGYIVTTTKFAPNNIIVTGVNSSGSLKFSTNLGLAAGNAYTSDNVQNYLALEFTESDGISYQLWSTLFGGNVSATITKSNTKEIEGTFSGTMFDSERKKSKNVTNGKFYIDLTK